MGMSLTSSAFRNLQVTFYSFSVNEEFLFVTVNFILRFILYYQGHYLDGTVLTDLLYPVEIKFLLLSLI